MTMRTSQLTSPWGMSGNGKFFKTWIKGPMTIRTRKLTCPHCHVKSYCLELAKTKTK